MPITKTGGVLVETPIQDKDQFDRTGSIRDDSFEIIDAVRTKKIKFDVQGAAPDTSVTLKVASGTTGDIVLTLPSTTSDLAGGTTTVANGGTGLTSYTAGDTLYASGTTTLSKLPIGSAQQVLKVQSGLPAWADRIEPTKDYTLFEDFLTGNTTSNQMTLASSGVSVAVSDSTNSVPSAAHPGIIKHTFSASTALGIFHLGDETIALGGGEVYTETQILFSHLSDGTDTMTFRLGFGDNFGTSADFTDGAYFYYTHSNNSGNWSCRTASNGSYTQADTSTAAAASTWTRLGILVNAAGTSVGFYINGALVATITTNIPTGFARRTSYMHQFAKSAGSASRFFIHDYVLIRGAVTR